MSVARRVSRLKCQKPLGFSSEIGLALDLKTASSSLSMGICRAGKNCSCYCRPSTKAVPLRYGVPRVPCRSRFPGNDPSENTQQATGKNSIWPGRGSMMLADAKNGSRLKMWPESGRNETDREIQNECLK